MLDILYEDNHLIVCYKPYGILSQSDGSNSLDMLTLLKKYVKEKYNKPGNVYVGLVHRLDRNTEGIMVFAKTSKAASRLSAQIREGAFNKSYIALIEGILKDQEGILINNLAKNENTRTAYESENGKKAILEYKVINTRDNYSLVNVKLVTGRFHQIRAQFSIIGHPLYGDIKYGSKNQTNYAVLQAYSLIFNHPITKDKMKFTKIDDENNFKNLKEIKYDFENLY